MELKNESGIKPLDTKLLVKMDQVEEITKGGIIIPATTTDKQKYAVQKATLVDMGMSCFCDWVEKPEIGARILIAQYAGSLIKGEDGQEYRIINDEDIVAELER